MAKLWVFVDFLTKKDLSKYIAKTSLHDETEMNYTKEEVVGKCPVKKVFLKFSKNTQENTLLESLF